MGKSVPYPKFIVLQGSTTGSNLLASKSYSSQYGGRSGGTGSPSSCSPTMTRASNTSAAPTRRQVQFISWRYVKATKLEELLDERFGDNYNVEVCTSVSFRGCDRLDG